MNYSNILLFTDLDGTLLNKDSFDYTDASILLRNCIKEGIKIIPNSSKTELELKEFCKDASLPFVFICENGACIHGLDKINNKLKKKIILSRTKDEVFKSFISKVDKNLNELCCFIHNLPLEEQIKILGLPKDKISNALNRKYSIPLIFKGGIKDRKKLNEQVKSLNLKMQDGGRILNLGDNVSKGQAMNLFVKKLSKLTNKKYVLIGVGDNDNDLDMLDSCDYPCVVKNGLTKNIHKKKYLHSRTEAPFGWVEVVKLTLEKIRNNKGMYE